MITVDKKKRREIAIFVDFVRASGIDIDVSTIESRDPPEPDIRCLDSSSVCHAFEMVELCSSKIAKIFGGRQVDRYAPMHVPDLDVSKVEAKFDKNYETDAVCHLLCYVDGRSVNTDDFLLAKIIGIDFKRQQNFSSVWYLGENRVLKVFPGQ